MVLHDLLLSFIVLVIPFDYFTIIIIDIHIIHVHLSTLPILITLSFGVIFNETMYQQSRRRHILSSTLPFLLDLCFEEHYT